MDILHNLMVFRGKYTSILRDNYPGKVSPEKNLGKSFPLPKAGQLPSHPNLGEMEEFIQNSSPAAQTLPQKP